MVRMISPVVKLGSKPKTGKGFSLGELREAGLNPGEARHLGVPVDLRRSTSHSENVESLKDWVKEARREGFRVPRPKQSSKGQKRRVYRGRTSSGQKMRALKK